MLLELSILDLHDELGVGVVFKGSVKPYNFVSHDDQGLLRVKDLLDLLLYHQDLLVGGGLHLGKKALLFVED